MAGKRRKRTLTAEERAARAEQERRADANAQLLRELVDRGWDELERKGVAKRPW